MCHLLSAVCVPDSVYGSTARKEHPVNTASSEHSVAQCIKPFSPESRRIVPGIAHTCGLVDTEMPNEWPPLRMARSYGVNPYLSARNIHTPCQFIK